LQTVACGKIENVGVHCCDGLLGLDEGSFIHDEKGLQLEFLASFALITTLNDAVALFRFLDSFGHFRGFMFHAEGFPIERRVG
jgi:hypothetical protein